MSPVAAGQESALRELRKDMLISVLALMSVAIGLYDLTHPRTSARWTTLDGIDLAIVVIFIFEFIWSASHSRNWRSYVRQHWYELPTLLPVTGNMTAWAEGVPLLRGLRLVRLVRVARLLRVVGAVARLQRFWRTALRISRRAHILGLMTCGAILVSIGAGLAWLIESPTNEAFRGGNSLWWAVNMLSNVAYVDFQPRTTGGRIVAGLLEFCGIGFIGLFTASLATAILTDQKEDEKKASE
jgi:voltage-gated potassium channel